MGNTQKTEVAGDPLALAKECIRNGQYEDAVRYLEQSLKNGETAGAWRNMALVHRARQDPGQAAACLEKALVLDDSDDASIALLGEIYFDRGDLRQAIGHYVLAIAENPDKFAYKERFIALAGLTPFYKYNEAMRDALLECLKTPALDCASAQILWYTLLTLNPEFKPLYKSSNTGSYVSFNRKSFDKAGDLSPLTDPFFLLGLKKIAVYHPVFEDFLTCLRQQLTEDIRAAKLKFARDDFTALAGALSHYCFYTEHIFDTTKEEDDYVRGLRSRLESDENVMKDAEAVALYACYAPLNGLKTAGQIAGFHAAGALADVIQLQVRDQDELVRLCGTAEAITEIGDGVSRKVQEQYEEFPYPRWKSYSKVMLDEEVEGGLAHKKAQILVAGCGTGREAIKLATVFPDADVLAIDLSRMSLAYAMFRAKDLGIHNITFRQADIMNLAVLDRKFDYISSSGVLHHLEYPAQGWKILCGLLQPQGLMRIALYSNTGRSDVVAAHKVIAKGNFANDAAGLRKFRRESPQLLERAVLQSLMNRGDYYHLSMYRDLLFHVQEHRFDIPGIESALKELGLEFIKFALSPDVAATYQKKYPADKAGKSLANWHAFETANPQTFSNMYHFWCRSQK